MRRIAVAAFSIVALTCIPLSSCSKSESHDIQLQETPVISGGLGWGVVSLAYVRLLLEPSSSSPDSGTARRGEVGRIVARSRSFDSRDAGIWYRVEIGSVSGWLHESALTVYRSEAEARKVAEAGS